MKKRLKIVLLTLLLFTLITPSIAKANWGGWYDGDTATTWSGSPDFGIVAMNGTGRYQYRPENDTFYCFLNSSSTQKPKEFLIIEESIFGKPVTRFFYIGESDLYSVPSKGLYIPDSVTNLDLFAFESAQFQNIYLSNALTTIPTEAFRSCKKLRQLQLPDGIKTIGEGAFVSCTKLKQLKIPTTVTTIEKEAFFYCKQLTKIFLPTSVKKIEKNAFKDCDNLTIYCEKNSYAYHYAKKNKIKTKLLSNKVVKANEITNLSPTIQVGTHETYLLFPFVEPFYATNQTLAYISDDPSIAEVNQNGKVEGKKKGTTTITVMTTDGSHLQKKVKVTVKQGETSINPYFSLYQLKKGTTEFNADAMFYNRNAKATYQITSSDSTIATAKVVDGTLKVTAKKVGNAMFVVTETNGTTKNKLGSFPINVINQ